MAVDWIGDAGFPDRVLAGFTTRDGGCSPTPWASLNLGDHVDDDQQRVRRNRRLLLNQLPEGTRMPWLRQVHGNRVVPAACLPGGDGPVQADASWTARPLLACAVLVADCLPILLCSDDGATVAAAHAGWRGMAAGIVEETLEALPVPRGRLIAWLGPCIGPCHFRIGPDVRKALESGQDAGNEHCFEERPGDGLYANLAALAHLRLERAGVGRIWQADRCTVCESQYFFSYRRDGVTGRSAAFILRR